MQGLFRLDGTVAVVTGALGKLGPIWTGALLDAGACVLGLDRPEPNPGEAFQRLQQHYGEDRLRLIAADVCNRHELEQACADCREAFGIPSILVNNAGIDQPPDQPGGGYRLEDIPLEVNRKVFEVNTLGLFLVTQIFGQPMVDAGRGSIINIGSLYASVAPDSRFYDHIQSDPPFLKPPAYGASKAAVVNLTRYLATLWASSGVRVNALSPGGVLGGQDDDFKRKFCARVPMGRMATEDDLRGPLLFLASEASAYVTGTELVVDGGFTAW
ncbi:MAG: SDR family oxidoreductase [Desulfobacterales bacterium]|nr:SDR family oxidoreductase [Desulfobacterales bacterium]MDJ0853984.1 SDR family oxidoreductase [Desulfobacterales bacterium]MDJ0989978.1 SDR family oxidoreductase [Desulfobacterales bacterium]